MSERAVTLAPEAIEAVAIRVVELLRDEGPAAPPPRLVDATQLARLLNVDRGWVYEHREQLGGIPLGEGKRPRWRFDRDRALAAWTAREANPEPEPTPTAPRRRPRTTSSAPLLPIGRKAT